MSGPDASGKKDRAHGYSLDSNRQTLTQALNFSQETRPKSKFFSLLIYAGYPIA